MGGMAAAVGYYYGSNWISDPLQTSAGADLPGEPKRAESFLTTQFTNLAAVVHIHRAAFESRVNSMCHDGYVMNIKTVATPYPTKPQMISKESPLNKGVFDSFSETSLINYELRPALEKPLLPGENRRTISHETGAHAHVTLAKNLQVPVHRIERDNAEPSGFGGGTEAFNKKGTTVAVGLEGSTLSLKDGHVSLVVQDPHEKKRTQTILEDGTTLFRDGEAQWNLHADGHATFGPDRVTPVEATLDPDGSVAFYCDDIVARVFKPILPLDQYLVLS